MAEVYKARHIFMDKIVAIKIIDPLLIKKDPSFKTRFLDECRHSAQFNHHHIIRVTDAGEDQDCLFMVMEYIPGQTLKEIIRKRGQLPLHIVSEYLNQIASALDFVHAQGLVHRDIKSGNIMIIEEENRAILMDFGISKAADSASLTQTGMHIGTPEYMSPEQGYNKPASKLSDVYALGIVVYEMLTGRVPFKADTPAVTLIQHMSEPVPLISQSRKDIPKEVENSLMRSLAKDPFERYQSAGEFAKAFMSEKRVVKSSPAGRPTPLVQKPTGVEIDEPGNKQKANVKVRRNALIGFAALVGLLGIIAITIALTNFYGNSGIKADSLSARQSYSPQNDLKDSQSKIKRYDNPAGKVSESSETKDNSSSQDELSNRESSTSEDYRDYNKQDTSNPESAEDQKKTSDTDSNNPSSANDKSTGSADRSSTRPAQNSEKNSPDNGTQKPSTPQSPESAKNKGNNTNAVAGNTSSPDSVAIIKTDYGDMYFFFYPDIAPNHVRRFIYLANKGFYKGVPFHRIVKEFMIQAGEPRSDWTEYISPLKLEVKEGSKAKHMPGALVGARTSNPDSFTTQFYIVITKEKSQHLEYKYSVFGQMFKGFDVLDRIQRVAVGTNPQIPSENSKPLNAIKIIDIKIVNSAPYANDIRNWEASNPF